MSTGRWVNDLGIGTGIGIGEGEGETYVLS